jgi:hypothetical protein
LSITGRISLPHGSAIMQNRTLAGKVSAQRLDPFFSSRSSSVRLIGIHSNSEPVSCCNWSQTVGELDRLIGTPPRSLSSRYMLP